MKVTPRSTLPFALAVAAALVLPHGAHAADSATDCTVFVISADDDGELTALRGATLTTGLPSLTTPLSMQCVAVAPNGVFGYAGGEEGTFQKFTVAGNAEVGAMSAFNEDTLNDLVISPDSARAYVALRYAGAVGVIDLVNFATVTTYPLPVLSSNTPNPAAIDVSADGTAVFVLNTLDLSLVKMSTADGTILDSVAVSFGATEMRVSDDGATVIVVGSSGARVFLASTLDPVAGGDTISYGPYVDVAVAGDRAFVLNDAYTPPQDNKRAGRAGPKAFNTPVVGEPSIEVYDVASGAHLETFPLGDPQLTVLGIAVTADAQTAFVSRRDSNGLGSVISMDLGTSALGPVGAASRTPRRLALGPAPAETIVASYCLPRSVAVKIAGAGKDSLGASGFFDVGGGEVDYAQPVTVEIGGFQRTFTLVPKGAGFVSPKDPVVSFAIVPNLKASSRGKFKMKLQKTTLAGLIDPAATLAFHFRGAGLADAAGAVKLTAGRYRLGKARGALVAPAFFPQRATATVGGANADSFAFRGGFATNGQTPAQLGDVRFAFGGTFTKFVNGAAFAKTGDVFKYADKQGATSFSITIDYLRETVTVTGKKVEIGDLAGPTTDVLFDTGDGGARNTIVLGVAGNKRGY